MSDRAPEVGSLSVLERRIEEREKLLASLWRKTVAEVWEQGRDLTEAKALVGHGHWLPWLKERRIARRTASHYMRIATHKWADLAHFATVEEVLEALAPGKSSRPGDPGYRGANDPARDEWYTVPEIVEACREAMGGIDLDPASCAEANEVVRADRYYTAEDDGLAQPWSGRVFLNPPYSKTGGKREFVEQVVNEYLAGRIEAACLLTFNDVSPRWGRVLREAAEAYCWIDGRRLFWSDKLDGNGPGLGGLVSYFGPDVDSFALAFKGLGTVSEPYLSRAKLVLKYRTLGKRIDYEIQKREVALEVKRFLGEATR